MKNIESPSISGSQNACKFRISGYFPPDLDVSEPNKIEILPDI
jgi:hypothetical protein